MAAALYLTFAASLLGTLHGAMAGTGSGNPGMQIVYWGSGLTVFFLTLYRLLLSKPARARLQHSQKSAG